MRPIHELINRIKWDKKFAQADFIIGYYDRSKNEVINVPLNRIYFDKHDRFDFELTDDTGEHRSIPLHRIRQVYRNGKLIWQREGYNS
jgi:uncharacterized protein (UPF0248 family)